MDKFYCGRRFLSVAFYFLKCSSGKNSLIWTADGLDDKKFNVLNLKFSLIREVNMRLWRNLVSLSKVWIARSVSPIIFILEKFSFVQAANMYLYTLELSEFDSCQSKCITGWKNFFASSSDFSLWKIKSKHFKPRRSLSLEFCSKFGMHERQLIQQKALADIISMVFS